MPVLSIDIEARLAKFQDGLDQVARSSGKTASEIEKSFRSVRTAINLIGGTWISQQLIQSIKATVDEMANLDDAAEQSGVSVEYLSSLLNTLAPTGVGIGQITDLTDKLTQAMRQSEKSTSAQAAAFKALGVSTKDSLGNYRDIGDVLDDVAKSLNKYSDGANKTAILQELLGKTGAQYAPVLKDIAQFSRQAASVTADQAAAAEQLKVQIGGLIRQFDIFKQNLASSVIPTILNLIEQFNAGIVAAGGFSNALLRYGTNLSSPGDNLARLRGERERLKGMVDAADRGDPSASIGPGGGFDPNAPNRLREELAQVERDIGYYQTLERQLGDVRSDVFDPRDAKAKAGGKGGKAAPVIPADRTAGGNTAKAQLNSDIADIERGLNRLTSVYGASESILEAQRSAGIVGEREYYEAKRSFINLNTEAQVSALQAENKRLAVERGSADELIANQRKIADNDAQIAKVRVEAASALEVLSTKETAANRAVVSSYEAARQAAQEYLDTIQSSQDVALAGMGLGQEARDRIAGMADIDSGYQRQRDALENNRQLLELERKWTPEAQAQYDERLAIINEFHDKARQSYEAFWEHRKKLESDWSLGVSEGLRNYLSEAENAYKQAADATMDALHTLEDGFADAMDGNYKSFRGFADAMEKDFMQIINRMVAKALTAELGKALGMDTMGASAGGGGGGFAGFLGSLFGGAGSGASAGNYAANAAQVADMWKFADGGIMTEFGRVPLRKYSMGGIANSPQAAIFGEGSSPEAYVPLPDGRTIPVTMAGGGGDTNIYISTPDAESFRRSEGQLKARVAGWSAGGGRFR